VLQLSNMNRNKLAILTLSVLLITLTLHLFGMYEHLYMKFWFYDIIVHILAGMGIALSAVYIFGNKKYIHIIITVMICGLLWEIFEAYYDITGAPVGSLYYKLDTVKDMIDDFLGAIIVWFSIKNK
jgi:hypothetical protein